jgi:hypothetical protein
MTTPHELKGVLEWRVEEPLGVRPGEEPGTESEDHLLHLRGILQWRGGPALDEPVAVNIGKLGVMAYTAPQLPGMATLHVLTGTLRLESVQTVAVGFTPKVMVDLQQDGILGGLGDVGDQVVTWNRGRCPECRSRLVDDLGPGMRHTTLVVSAT